MLTTTATRSVERLPDGTSWRLLTTPAGPRELESGRSYGRPEVVDNAEKNCPGNVNLLFSPHEYYLVSLQLPKMKPELLALQITRKFANLALTMEADTFAHRFRRNPKNPEELECIFVPKAEVQEYMPLLARWKGVRSARLIPVPLAVAAVIDRLTTEAVMVLLIEKSYAQVIVVHRGAPIYNQMLAQVEPGVVEDALLPNAIDFARTTVRNDHQINDLHIITMGSARSGIDLSPMAITEWQPDLSPLAGGQRRKRRKGGGGITLDTLLDTPQLYGAPLVRDEWSFVDQEFNLSWKLQALSRRITAVAAVVAVVAALLGGWFHLRAEEAAETWQAARTRLAAKRSLLAELQADTESLDNFGAVAAIRSSADNDFRLDDLLYRLSVSLPEGVLITGLEVSRAQAAEPAGGSDTSDDSETIGEPDEEVVSPAALFSRTVAIELTCSATGDRRSVTRRFEQALVLLSRLFVVSNGRWSYDEATAGGILSCSLRPQSRSPEPGTEEVSR